jgi:hypothetical protein
MPYKRDCFVFPYIELSQEYCVGDMCLLTILANQESYKVAL